MPRLLIECPGQRPSVFELPEGQTVKLGRGATCDVVLLHPSVSRSHALMTVGPDGKWRIVDLGSANGVAVNGAVAQEAALKRNDEVTLGAYTLRFEEPGPEDSILLAAAKLPDRLAEALKKPAQGRILWKASAATPLAVPAAASGMGIAGRISVLEHENRLLTLLYQVARALGELATVEEVTERVLELVLQIEGAQRGYAMLLDESSSPHGKLAPGPWKFLPAVIRYRREPPDPHTPKLVISNTIIGRVFEEGVPLLVTDARADERFSASQSIALSGVQSAMCAPLGSRDAVYGLLYVDNLSRSQMFTSEDLNIFAVIAAQAGMAIERVRNRAAVEQQQLKLNALERFLSPDIARKVTSQAAKLELGGENEQVTLLFADIRGFTSLSEKIPAQEVVGVLNEFFETMTDIVFQNGGALDKYLGDGMMCLFGAPFAHERAAADAVRTAIAMQKSLIEFNKTSPHPVEIGIGVNTGPVVVGFIGSPRRMDYTAVGDAVNIAARLTGLARSGQILASAATFAELGNEFPARSLEPMKVKGRVQPIEVYEILWKEYATEESSRPVKSAVRTGD